MQFQIQDHNLTVIATDGDNVFPKVVDAIVSLSGERYDFVVTANQESGAFWIYISGLFVCQNIERVDQVNALVIFEYTLSSIFKANHLSNKSFE